MSFETQANINHESNNHRKKFRLPERDLKEFWFERDGKKLIKKPPNLFDR